MGRIIALANQKGGSGKTTSTACLGACLAELGKRVLVVDLDPQGHLGLYFGIDIENLRHSVYNLLVDAKAKTSNAIRHYEPLRGLHIIPSNIDLCGAEVQLVAEIGREQLLAQRLHPLKDQYDYMLIDCPPSLGLLVVNALTAADEVLVPLQCSYLALRGLGMLTETIERVAGRLNPRLRLGGVLLTMQDNRTLHAREVEKISRQRFGDLVYKTVIHRSVRFDEAPVQGEPISLYAADTRGAREYLRFAKEVIDGEKASQDRIRAAR